MSLTQLRALRVETKYNSDIKNHSKKVMSNLEKRTLALYKEMLGHDSAFTAETYKDMLFLQDFIAGQIKITA